MSNGDLKYYTVLVTHEPSHATASVEVRTKNRPSDELLSTMKSNFVALTRLGYLPMESENGIQDFSIIVGGEIPKDIAYRCRATGKTTFRYIILCNDGAYRLFVAEDALEEVADRGGQVQ